MGPHVRVCGCVCMRVLARLLVRVCGYVWARVRGCVCVLMRLWCICG